MSSHQTPKKTFKTPVKALKQTKLDSFYKKKSPTKKPESLSNSFTDKVDSDVDTTKVTSAQCVDDQNQKQSPILMICDRTDLMDESDIKAAEDGNDNDDDDSHLNSTGLDSFNVSLINCSDLQQSMVNNHNTQQQSKGSDINGDQQVTKVDIHSGDSFESTKTGYETNDDNTSWCSANDNLAQDALKKTTDPSDKKQVPSQTACFAESTCETVPKSDVLTETTTQAIEVDVPKPSEPVNQIIDSKQKDFSELVTLTGSNCIGQAQVYPSQIPNYSQQYTSTYTSCQQTFPYHIPAYCQYPQQQQQVTNQIYSNGYYQTYASTPPVVSYPTSTNTYSYAPVLTTPNVMPCNTTTMNQFMPSYQSPPKYYQNSAYVQPTSAANSYYTNQQAYNNNQQQYQQQSHTYTNYNQYSKPVGYMPSSTPPLVQHTGFYQPSQQPQQQQQHSPQQNSSPTYATLTSYNSQYASNAQMGFYNHGNQIQTYIDQQNHQALSYPSSIYAAKQMGSPTY